MPHTFDMNFKNTVARIREQIVSARNNYPAQDQQVIDNLLGQMMIVESDGPAAALEQAWTNIMEILGDNMPKVMRNKELSTMGFTDNLTAVDLDDQNTVLKGENAVQHWQFQNAMHAAFRALKMVPERGGMAGFSDQFKAYTDAVADYEAKKEDAVRSISGEYGSIEELERSIRKDEAAIERLAQEIAVLEAQADYRQNSRQAIMVAVYNLTDEQRAARSALQEAIDRRKEALAKVQDLEERLAEHDKQVREREAALQARADEIQKRRDQLDQELKELEKEVSGETSVTVNVVANLSEHMAVTKALFDEAVAEATEQENILRQAKPKRGFFSRSKEQDNITSVTFFLDLLKNHDEVLELDKKINGFVNTVSANPRLAKVVEGLGDKYTTSQPATLKALAMVKTDANRLALEYFDLYKKVKAGFAAMDKFASHYKKDANGERLRDEKGNLVRDISLEDQFTQSCHSFSDLVVAVKKLADDYSALITQGKADAPDQQVASLAKVHSHFAMMQAIRGSSGTAQRRLEEKQEELNRFCVSVYDEEQEIREQMKNLQDEASLPEKMELVTQLNEAKEALNQADRITDEKGNALESVGERLKAAVEARENWEAQEKYKELKKGYEDSLRKHNAVLDKIRQAHEAHLKVIRTNEDIMGSMPDGRIPQTYFAGLAEQQAAGMTMFVKTADVGRKDAKRLDQPGYDRRGHNSEEYNAMVDAITGMADERKLKAMRPEQMIESLREVQQSAQHYLDMKKKEWSEWLPSPSVQRKVRLAYAREVIRFCQEAIVSVENVKNRVDSLEHGYAVNHIGPRTTMNYDQMKQVVTHQVNETTMKAKAAALAKNDVSVKKDQPVKKN